MKRVVACLLLFIVFPVFCFASNNDFEIMKYKKEGKAVVLSLAASYFNKPKIELPGVEFTSGKGLLPTSISFSTSDISSYSDALANPTSSTFFSFLSSLTSSLSPLVTEAIDALSECELSKGDFILDGFINIEGGEDLTLSTLLFGSDFSSLSLKISGEATLSGKDNISTSFDIRCVGDKERVIFIYFDSLVVDRNAVFLQPLMISLKMF